MSFKLEIKDKKVGDRTYKIIETDYASAVVILNAEQDHMLLVKQNRPVIDDETWEIPAGLLDVEGESARGTAAREVKEETGKTIEANDLNVVTHYFPMIGLVKHKIYVFKTVLDDMTIEATDDNDVTESQWFSFDQIEKMINDSEILDGKTILAFYKVAYELLKNKRTLTSNMSEGEKLATELQDVIEKINKTYPVWVDEVDDGDSISTPYAVEYNEEQDRIYIKADYRNS